MLVHEDSYEQLNVARGTLFAADVLALITLVISVLNTIKQTRISTAIHLSAALWQCTAFIFVPFQLSLISPQTYTPHNETFTDLAGQRRFCSFVNRRGVIFFQRLGELTEKPLLYFITELGNKDHSKCNSGAFVWLFCLRRWKFFIYCRNSQWSPGRTFF